MAKNIHSIAAGLGAKVGRRSPDGARVWVRSVAWVSPSGPVAQDRTARRLRAVVDAEACAHHLASARVFFMICSHTPELGYCKKIGDSDDDLTNEDSIRALDLVLA